MRPRTSYTRGMSTYRYPHTIENGAGERITFVRRVQDSAGDCVEVENVVKPGSGPHRLEAMDIALSRRKNAGGGTLGSPLFGGLFLECVMHSGENRIEMRIPRSGWLLHDLRFPHS